MKIPYDSKYAIVTTRIFDMVVLSFFWLVLCLPVLTIVPSTIALYYTAAKVLRRDAGYVTSEFFHAFRVNLRQGVALNVLYLILAAFLGGIYLFCEWQGIDSSLGGSYYIFYLLVIVVVACISFFLFPVLSRFQVTLGSALRLSVYFCARNPGTVIPFVIAFAGMCALMYVVPISVLIVPGFFAYQMTRPVEKILTRYIRDELPDPQAHEGMWYMDTTVPASKPEEDGAQAAAEDDSAINAAEDADGDGDGNDATESSATAGTSE